MTGPTVEERALNLADGLSTLALDNRQAALVVFCDDHQRDGEIAWQALQKLGVAGRRLPPATVLLCGSSFEPTLVVACPEGTAAWRSQPRRGVLLGDAPGEIWWRLFELRGRTNRWRAIGEPCLNTTTKLRGTNGEGEGHQ
jgi:hypothetical protein